MCDYIDSLDLEAQKSNLIANEQNNLEKVIENGKATESIDVSIHSTISGTIVFNGKVEKKPETNSTLKRSSRRQTGSIIQSAIARKERAFDYDTKSQPRHRKKLKNGKNLLGDVMNEKNVSTKLIVKNQKSTKHESSESDNNVTILPQGVDLPLRRSERILSSDKEDSKITSNRTISIGNHSSENLFSSKLCKCTENRNLYLDPSENETVFCTATDSIDGKIIGCSKLVDCRKMPMLRPSQRMPFGVMCETHMNRLIRHNCCPTCGLFCTQGKFAQCISKHQYHRNCQVTIEDEKCCPHCGIDKSSDIFITMHCSKKPVFLPIQKTQDDNILNIWTVLTTSSTAKMSFVKDQEVLDTQESSISSSLLKSLEVINHHLKNKTTSVDKVYTPSELFEAILTENVKKVALILEKNSIDLTTTFPESNQGTLLHLAVQKGNLTVLHLLISKGMDLDIFDKDQNTPLMLAVIDHKNDLVRYLIQSGADMKVKGTDGMTALHISAKCGNLEACQLLVKAGFGIQNYVDVQDDGGWTPLVWACEHSHLEVVKFFIQKGASVTLRDVEHNSALHWAALSGSNDIVELLLNFGCEVNAVNVHGETPLHISAREDHFTCVITLLARGADVLLINKNNERPLDCAPADSESYTAIALNMQLQKNVKFGHNSLLHNDISRGREQNPIQCHNTLDAESEPRDYVYILKNRFASEDISIDTRISIMRSCTCEDKCVSAICSCNEVSVGHWYDTEGKLIPEFNFNDPPMLFECNEMCSCNYITCTNRVVQKSLTHRFQLFRTMNKGWGVKTLNAIPKGSFVCEYIGEILTDREADKREDDSYLFDLDNRESDSFCVDAKFYGNFARFINHSCDPNLHSIKVFVDHHDLRFPRIALFAKKDIGAQEELSFDYGDKFWLVKYKSFTCDCQADSCKYSAESIHKTLETYYENNL